MINIYDCDTYMTIYDYIQAHGDIFKTNDPLFTADIKAAVNRMLKFNYRNKLMVYTDPIEVQELVDMILFDKKHMYSNMFNLINYTLPADYTEKSNVSSTKDNTGTQKDQKDVTKDNTGTQTDKKDVTRDNTGTQTDKNDITKDNTGTQTDKNDITKDNTGTQTIKDDLTKDNTGTQTDKNTGTVKNTGTDKHQVDGTTTVDPNDVTRSKLGFDGGALVANEKEANSTNKTTVANTDLETQDLTRTDDLTHLRTDALKEVVSDTNLRTDALKEIVSDTNLRTDALKEVISDINLRTDALKEIISDTNLRTDALKEVISDINLRTDALKESLSEENKNINISVRLEELQAMIDNTSKLLYRIVAEDVVSVIALRTW